MYVKEKQRLSKVMAQAGVASRRHCEEIIFSGRVTVNGEKTLLPQTPVSDEDDILVDGKALSGIEPKAYYLLNKPTGYVCANFDRHYKKVKDLFNKVNLRLFTVGRLDKETSGLLIVTNDGHFAQRVIHPSANIEKEYLAQVDRPITNTDLNTKPRKSPVLIAPKWWCW
jgi:23S rRNA pseudouridine2605 synthase